MSKFALAYYGPRNNDYFADLSEFRGFITANDRLIMDPSQAILFSKEQVINKLCEFEMYKTDMCKMIAIDSTLVDIFLVMVV